MICFAKKRSSRITEVWKIGIYVISVAGKSEMEGREPKKVSKFDNDDK